jgi:hypothetical protein
VSEESAGEPAGSSTRRSPRRCSACYSLDLVHLPCFRVRAPVSNLFLQLIVGELVRSSTVLKQR